MVKKRIGLIAHDKKNDEIIELALEYSDPMTPHPHEPDINALMRACDAHNMACTTNLATVRLFLSQLQLARHSHSY
jgi:methylglyoxal synthase